MSVLNYIGFLQTQIKKFKEKKKKDLRGSTLISPMLTCVV